MTKKHLDTTLVQAGRSKKYTQGSVNSVIQRASLVFDTVETKIATRNRAKGGLFYGRRGTLTHFTAGSHVRAGRRRRLRAASVRRGGSRQHHSGVRGNRATIFWMTNTAQNRVRISAPKILS